VVALQRYLGERLPPTFFPEEVVAQGVFTLDSSGIPKKGRHSVGVAPQYCGQVGKVTNCQVGVFLGYATAAGHALLDARLYLPPAWATDPERCRAAGVPEDIVAQGYQSQAALGLALLRRARTVGALPGRWVTVDAGFGALPTFRDALDAEGWQYVAEVPSTTRVFTAPPWRETVVLHPGQPARPVEITPAAVPVATVAATLPATAWHPLTVGSGALGPRTYAFAAQRVWECRDDAPGQELWLLLRRDLDAPGGERADGENDRHVKYAFSNASAHTPLSTLARVGASRWTVETEFQQGKNEVGLDEYEVRSWRGWHHHMILCLLAAAFLLTLQQDWGEKPARRDPPATDPRPARVAAPPPLHVCRAAPLAPRHASAQCPRHRRPCQTALTPAA
jgi:SRSO17 transposase